MNIKVKSFEWEIIDGLSMTNESNKNFQFDALNEDILKVIMKHVSMNNDAIQLDEKYRMSVERITETSVNVTVTCGNIQEGKVYFDNATKYKKFIKSKIEQYNKFGFIAMD